MSATVARQGGQVLLEQSDMRPALYMAKMAKEGFSCTAMEVTQQVIKKPWAEVRREKKWADVIPGHNNGKAAIECHLAMVRENQTDGCLPCQNGTAKIPQTRWRRKGTGAPPPRPAPPLPRMPPAPPDDSERTLSSETDGVPAGYVYIHTPLPSTQFFNLHPYANDRMHEKDFIPDLLTDEGPSTC